MATMEDRLLGEKLHYYCSSDESDIEEEDEGNKEENEFDVDKSRQAKLNEISEKEAYMNGPRQHNTGIKGVKEDARAYQLYILQKEQEKLDDLAKTAARFCLNERPKSDDEFDLEEDDEFMAAYRSKRMTEMKEKAIPTFGRIIELSDKDYCDVIDGAHPSIDVVVYVYEDHLAACRRYKDCLSRLAEEFPKCMICHIRASKAHMSANFIQKGLPCFIKYRGGDVKKTWVNIRDFIGDDAEYDVLVEGMQDNGVLPYE